MNPEDIAKRTPENPDSDHHFIECPECGDFFATASGGDVACTSPECRYYDEYYAEALDGLAAGGMAIGALRTKRGVDIPFLNIIDRGHYYAVFIPGHKWQTVYTRAYYYPVYDKFVKYGTIWPYEGVAGEPGARGAQLLTYNAKVITIQKKNVEYIK